MSKSACMDEVNKKKLTILPFKNLVMERQNYIIYNEYFTHIDSLQEIVNRYKKELSIM